MRALLCKEPPFSGTSLFLRCYFSDVYQGGGGGHSAHPPKLSRFLVTERLTLDMETVRDSGVVQSRAVWTLPVAVWERCFI